LNVIRKHGLMDLIEGESKDVRTDVLAWYRVAKAADWASFADVRATIADTDLVNKLLVFNIRQNRFRLIVYPVFSHRKLYVKALLTHKEYDRKDWVNRWP
jgi:mRNA interferase HigB